MLIFNSTLNLGYHRNQVFKREKILGVTQWEVILVA
jgi:hypothetical protein